MQVRAASYSILFLFFGLLFSLPSYGQKVREQVGSRADSMAWRKHVLDSTRDARQQEIDIAKKSRQHILDSTRDARQQQIEADKENRKNTLEAEKVVRQHIMDSTRQVRQRMMDSSKDARQRIMDSTKQVRQQKMDSMQQVRKQTAKKLDAIRKYKESKRYKDSVTRAQTAKANQLKAKRKAYTDSITSARKKVIDSMSAARKVVLTAMHDKLKKRTDSLDKIRKYKESKRYRDSVIVFKKARAESIAKTRKHFSDSVMTVRKHFVDSIAKVRKKNIDSMASLREKRMDKLKESRKKHADSLAQVKTKKENQIKANQKKEEQKKQLALELKIKKQHEAWSNEKMLKKKWTLKRKIIQNTFTRYNYYFNANRKMEEALANMQRVKKENYDSLIELYPFNPNRDSTLLASDMDSILHKISVGIQIHDPRSKWEDDMYLLMGEAQYYKGRYNDAGTAFHYIISMDEQKKKKPGSKDKTDASIVQKNKKTIVDFLKHKPVHNEAILWLARTFTQAGQPEKSESVLALLDADSNLPKSLLGRVAMERAFLAMNENNYKAASKQLSIAADDKYLPTWLRERAGFINGQLLQYQGDYTASAAAFQKVLDLNPKIDMDFYARKYMAFNTMYAGKDASEAQAALKSVLGDNKYSAYYEQVYFALGIISAQGNDHSAAIDYLQKSIHTLKSTKKQKAISFAALGNVYYLTGDYVLAKHAYDSAAKFMSYAPTDTLVITAVNRSGVLDNVTGPALTLHEQDSLLALAMLNNKDQRSIVRKYIRHLEDMRRDSIFRAENAGVTAVATAEPGEDNAASIWYFANATMMQQGFNEFKRKWGNRPNADNWRRMSAMSFASSGNNNGSLNNSGTNLETNGAVDETGLPTEDFLLAAIPNTPEQQAAAYKSIQVAYVDLADAYINKLADYAQAIKTLDTLDKRFPSHDMQARVLYLRYIVALRNHDFDKAKLYSTRLMTEYANTEYAAKVKPAEDGSNLPNPAGVSVSAFYDETYNLLMQRQYTDVILKVQQADKLYKDPKYKPRFRLVHAMALAATADYTQADSVLNDFFALKPVDSLRIIGESVKNYIAKNRPAPIPSAQGAKAPTANNLEGMNKTLNSGTNPTPSELQPGADKTDTTKTNPNTTQEDNKPGYHYNPNAQHYCVIALPGLDSRALGIKAALGDFNTFKYAAAGLIANMDVLNPRQAMLVVKAFNNAEDARNYMLAMKGTPAIFHDYKPEEYQVFIISGSNYTQLFVDHGTGPYMGFYKVNYKQ